jgi:NADH:ubiquinone oxidoreductase subunit C
MLYLSQYLASKRKSALITLKKEIEILCIATIAIIVRAEANLTSVYSILKNQAYAVNATTVVDTLEKTNRYSLIYLFTSLQNTSLMCLQIPLSQYSNLIITASEQFPATFAAEKEVYDMYGIFFKNHPDLRRILTDYSFKGNPLKKDFPLSGFTELRYSIIKKTLLFLPLSLSQEFRVFTFGNPFLSRS